MDFSFFWDFLLLCFGRSLAVAVDRSAYGEENDPFLVDDDGARVSRAKNECLKSIHE